MKNITLFLLIILYLCANSPIVIAQSFWENYEFSERDSLRGQLSLERTCYDVLHYDLNIEIIPEQKYIKGSNEISFLWAENSNLMQIDLFENMEIDSIIFNEKNLPFYRKYDAIFIELPILNIGEEYKIITYYQGQPIIGKNPPWDGGLNWVVDEKDRSWISVSCEHLGASAWWPNKDHLSDEPDSMDFTLTFPNNLNGISNGRLIDEKKDKINKTQHWKVSYPINNYNVTFYLGHYKTYQDSIVQSNGKTLDIEYYFLDYNEDKAIPHFEQTKNILHAYDHYFGPYPFQKDGFKLVESSYLGMEHQSAIAYGNQYKRGYLGGLIPPEMDLDFIIVHETGHEYFGNSVSCNDHSDMWIHESFTTYMEALYVEFIDGYDAYLRYLKFEKSHGNKEPIIGPSNVNFGDWKVSDHYFKGSWILHTLRHVINDDKLFFNMIKSLYQTFEYKNVTNEDIFNYINDFTGRDFNSFFQQYLFQPNIPTLEIKNQTKKDGYILFDAKWNHVIDGFTMDTAYGTEENKDMYFITDQWSSYAYKLENRKDEPRFYNDRFLIDIEFTK